MPELLGWFASGANFEVGSAAAWERDDLRRAHRQRVGGGLGLAFDRHGGPILRDLEQDRTIAGRGVARHREADRSVAAVLGGFVGFGQHVHTPGNPQLKRATTPNCSESRPVSFNPFTKMNGAPEEWGVRRLWIVSVGLCQPTVNYVFSRYYKAILEAGMTVRGAADERNE